MWEYRDRLILSLLLKQIKATFPHLISSHCLHLKGPPGVKTALTWLYNAMSAQSFQYVIRADIKNYYASIDLKVLLAQTQQAFDDRRVSQYLEAIITAPVDNRAQLMTPQRGIPRRSSLSPFFGALYLTPLDRAFENCSGVFFLRYMDDFLILAQTKAQFLRAKKKLYRILRELKLTLSDSKTRMGKIYEGFHFLGVQLNVPRSHSTKTQPPVVSIHSRSCNRAFAQVRFLKDSAVHPAHIQIYLRRWAGWWACTLCPFTVYDLLHTWIRHTQFFEPDWTWLARAWLF